MENNTFVNIQNSDFGKFLFSDSHVEECAKNIELRFNAAMYITEREYFQQFRDMFQDMAVGDFIFIKRRTDGAILVAVKSRKLDINHIHHLPVTIRRSLNA